MGVYKTIIVNETTKVLIWNITETLATLKEGIDLTPASKKRLEGMKSEIHQKGFMSVRQLLKEVGYNDGDLMYDGYGKPHLKDGKYISITHSYTFSAIIISDDLPAGIDIEKRRDKILKIAHKFTTIDSYKSIANHDALVSKLTIVWGAKESIYKIYGKKKLLFLDHIYIEDFSFETNKTKGKILYESVTSEYEINFLEFDEFTCVYAV